MLAKIQLCMMVVAVCGPFVAPATGAGNVLGLPQIDEPQPTGALVLHGGGRVTLEAFDRFVALAGGPESRIVLVPSASYRANEYASPEQFVAVIDRRFSEWMRLPSRGKAASVELLHTDDPRDADEEAFVQPLTRATGVWFCGGEQAHLNYRYVGSFPNQTRFQTALRGVLERGGVVGGTSAGMAALPEIMTVTEMTFPKEPSQAVVRHGLGLLTGAIVEQHFDGRHGRFERFANLLRDDERLDVLAGRDGAGARMLGLAVEERTALVLQANHLEVVGAGNVHVFIKLLEQPQISWHTLSPGNKAKLHYDQRGQALLSRE